MSLKFVYGDTHDINFDPRHLERWKRDEVGRNYFKLKANELFRLIVFWGVLALVFVLMLFSFTDSLFVFLCAAVFYLMIKFHFNYLIAWSRWNKFARRSVVRMDLEKDCSVVVGPKVPWIKLKGERRGI